MQGCTNTSEAYQGKGSAIHHDDATWILTSSFIIFTMQSGFGLLESGMVSRKNEINIMVKNFVDVIFGGLTFWMVGFGLAFGQGSYNNAFCGFGYFFLNVDDSEMGLILSWFTFQMSFATTSTTVVSGAMAERVKLTAYIIFSSLNVLVYCFPAHWIWDQKGFLNQLGVIDVAGGGVVHLVGGCSALVATIILKPRTGQFSDGCDFTMGCPTNSLIGLFMLWWGWLGFNCGSSFGISHGKWKLATRAAVATLCASMGGGTVCCAWSWLMNRKKIFVQELIYGILGSLVSFTAICAVASPWESVTIGCIGSILSLSTARLMIRLKIDDPVGIFAVHGVAGMWAMIAVGLFSEKTVVEELHNVTPVSSGLFRGGGFILLGVQLLGALILVCWSAVCTICLLKAIDRLVGLRVTLEEERLGLDLVEHGIEFEDGKDEDNVTSPVWSCNELHHHRDITSMDSWEPRFKRRHNSERSVSFDPEVTFHQPSSAPCSMRLAENNVHGDSFPSNGLPVNSSKEPTDDEDEFRNHITKRRRISKSVKTNYSFT